MTISNIDPIPQFRNALNDGLQIQGQVSFPKTLALDTIQPVYVINPFSIRRNKYYQIAYNLAGAAFYNNTLIDTNNLNVQQVNLTFINLIYSEDVAGRAASIVAGEPPILLKLQMLDPSNTVFVLGEMFFNFAANAGHSLRIQTSNFSQCNSLYNGGDYWPIPQTTLLFKSINIPFPNRLQIFIGTTSGTNFQANTTLNGAYGIEY